MVEIAALQSYCDDLLASAGFDDHGPNGVQVEGERPIRRLVTGVTASQALIDAASGQSGLSDADPRRQPRIRRGNLLTRARGIGENAGSFLQRIGIF